MNNYSNFGRLGKDPEARETPNGKHLTEASVAVKRWGDKPPLWIKLTIWGDKGSKFREYAEKGTEIYFQGDLDVREYEKNDGSTGYSVECTVSDFRITKGWKEKANTPVAPNSDFDFGANKKAPESGGDFD